MARTQLLFVALAVLVASAGAALTDKASVQEFANENGQTVLKVQAASPWALYAQFQNIETRLNDLAGERKDGQWYAIDEWGSQQSNWDLLVQLANVAVGDIWAVLPSVPQKPETLTEYGSKTPRADLKGVAQKICKQIAILQPYAKYTYNVHLDLTTMTACSVATPNIKAFSISEDAEEGVAAPAPAPAPARRLLAA